MDRTLRLTDLPSEALAHAASYLAPPSKAFFALAMQEGELPSSNNEGRCGFIRRSDWTVLDFGTIEKSLASRLIDDHIEKMLQLIDAAANLRTLKLAGCVTVTGSCLGILHGSTRLEHVDISLVGQHESPAIKPEPNLSEVAVLPFLDNIIDTEGSSLNLVILPKEWRDRESVELQEFLRRYDTYLNRKQYACASCGGMFGGALGGGSHPSLGGENYFIGDRTDDDRYGTRFNMCYECNGHFCYKCAYDSGIDEDATGFQLRLCMRCDRERCLECSKSWEKCPACGFGICKECGGLNKCTQCGIMKCDWCAEPSGQCNSVPRRWWDYL